VYRDGSREVQVLHAGSKKPDQAPITSDVVPYLVKRDLLEVEDAKRHKVMWKGTKMYTIVSIDENEKPIEVFTKLPKEAGINGSGVYSEPMYQEHASNWDALCRAISLGLRYGISVEEYIEQMDKASYTMVDAPGTIARVLRKYEASDLSDFSADEVITQSLGDECPDCGEMTYIHEGGCTKCLLCGYSECK
jgi:ribonucleoside-diphosphate reductase alpha chain